MDNNEITSGNLKLRIYGPDGNQVTDLITPITRDFTPGYHCYSTDSVESDISTSGTLFPQDASYLARNLSVLFQYVKEYSYKNHAALLDMRKAHPDKICCNMIDVVEHFEGLLRDNDGSRGNSFQGYVVADGMLDRLLSMYNFFHVDLVSDLSGFQIPDDD